MAGPRVHNDRNWLATTPFVAVLATLQLSVVWAASPNYAASYYTGTQTESPKIVVFPTGPPPITIELPLQFRAVRFAPDGRAFYGITLETKKPIPPQTIPGLEPPRLNRIDLNPVRISSMLSLSRFDSVYSFAVSPQEDKLIFSGGMRSGPINGYSLFELSLATGDVRMLAEGPGFAEVSLSPDGGKVLVRHQGRLELIDIVRRTTNTLGGNFWLGAWSPDGKWIAALGNGPHGRSSTFLIDANDISRQRDMGGKGDTEVVWSPDSRYLLYSEPQRRCPESRGVTLVEMDIESGKRSDVASSVCKVSGYRKIGWITIDALGLKDPWKANEHSPRGR